MRIAIAETGVRGYTLIEVLVAMTILAMALVVLMRIFSGGLNAVRVAGDYAGAVVLAESRLAAAGVSEPLAEGETQGRHDRFAWTQVVARYEPEGVADWPVPAYQVDVVIEWPGPTGTRSLDLTTVKLERPTPPRTGRRR